MKKILLSIALPLLVISNSFAGEQEVKEKAVKQLPAMTIVKVNKMSTLSLYEVVFINKTNNNSGTILTNENVDWFVVGPQLEVIDAKSKVNITAENDIKEAKLILSKLPYKESFSVKYGKGTRNMVIFSDPDCPSCKALEKNINNDLLQNNADVTIHYFMNPLTTIHLNAMERAKNIWCSKEPSKAWINYLINDKLPSELNSSCANPVEKNKNLAISLGINSTPTIMFDNGIVTHNVLTSKEIVGILNQRKP